VAEAQEIFFLITSDHPSPASIFCSGVAGVSVAVVASAAAAAAVVAAVAVAVVVAFAGVVSVSGVGLFWGQFTDVCPC